MLQEGTDRAVQEYIKSLRSIGGTVNTCIVMAAAEAIISTRHPGYLQEQGGSFKSLLIRMNFVKRKSSMQEKCFLLNLNCKKKAS